MKTLFFKNGMPVLTAVLAIAGAFATTSMQSSSNTFGPKFGYILQANGDCSNITVMCSDVPKPQVCKFSYPNGEIAFELLPAGNCPNVLWRP